MVLPAILCMLCTYHLHAQGALRSLMPINCDLGHDAWGGANMHDSGNGVLGLTSHCMEPGAEVQDVTEEVAEVLLGKKANKGIIPQV